MAVFRKELNQGIDVLTKGVRVLPGLLDPISVDIGIERLESEPEIESLEDVRGIERSALLNSPVIVSYLVGLS